MYCGRLQHYDERLLIEIHVVYRRVIVLCNSMFMFIISVSSCSVVAQNLWNMRCFLEFYTFCVY